MMTKLTKIINSIKSELKETKHKGIYQFTFFLGTLLGYVATGSIFSYAQIYKVLLGFFPPSLIAVGFLTYICGSINFLFMVLLTEATSND